MEIGNQNRHMLMILLIVFLAFMSSMASVAIAQETSYSIDETRITTDGKAILPVIYADKIAYIVYHSNGYLGDIYMHDLTTQDEIQVYVGTITRASLDMYGPRTVWSSDNTEGYNIYMYDLSTYDLSTKINTITNDGKSCYPSIHGNKIVYLSGNSYSDIYIYDISTGQEPTQITTGATAILPDIYNDKIVWCENYNLYMYDISNGQGPTQITYNGKAVGAHIYEDKIAWSDSENKIHIYDISTSVDVTIASTNYSNVPNIFEDKVVWSDYHDSHSSDDIFMYNMTTSEKTQITTNGHSRDPNIFGNKIVYRNYGGNVGFGTDVYMSTFSIITPGTVSLNSKAAELTKQVFGVPYLWGGKGWDYEVGSFADSEKIITGYKYYNPKIGGKDFGSGLDCSGLVLWAYNKAYGSTKFNSDGNPVRYEGADSQYRYEFKIDITENELKPGDLLFFDAYKNSAYTEPGQDGHIDHVAMYVGPFSYENVEYNVVESRGGVGVTPTTVNDIIYSIESWAGYDAFVGYRRLAEAEIGMEVVSDCPVDLIVTDPDGIRATKEISEVPGVFYYSEWDMDGDGNLDDQIILPEKKNGAYNIEVIPEPGAEPIETYTIKVTANDQTIILAENVKISDIPTQPYTIMSNDDGITLIDEDTSPVANDNGPYTADEGSPITFDASGSTDPDGDTLQYRWDFDNDGVWNTILQSTPTASYTWYDDFSGNAMVEVSDGTTTAIATASVIVNNVAPTVDAGPDQTVDEGELVAFSGSYTDAGTKDTHTFEWNFGDGPTASSTLTPTYTYADNGVYTVTSTVTDDDGGVGTDTLTVTVNNVQPVLDTIAVPIDSYKVNTPVAVSCSFTDAGILDTHTAVWDWGDGTASAGIVAEINGAGTVTSEHTYAKAGIYKISLTVTEDDTGTVSKTSESYVVVYDSAGGFVTGGGWINSPAGAYVSDSTMSGKATFEFASMYAKKTTKPTGITMFQLKMSKVGNGHKPTKTTNLNFKSTSYDWLVVSGNQAKCKGTGTINGKGNYGFMISIVDGKNKENGIDKFRIKIWDKASGEIVYDNQIGASEDAEPTITIGGGSIAIHNEK